MFNLALVWTPHIINDNIVNCDQVSLDLVTHASDSPHRSSYPLVTETMIITTTSSTINTAAPPAALGWSLIPRMGKKEKKITLLL